MTSRPPRISPRSALAETARSFPLCILTAFVTTAGLLLPDAQTKWLGYPTFALLTATALPSAFGALAGALAFQDASPGKRLVAHGIGFGLGLAGALLSRLGLWNLPGEDEATALSLGFLAYLAVALYAARAAGDGRTGFWHANVVGLTSLVIVSIGFVGVVFIHSMLNVFLGVRAVQVAGVFHAVGLGLVCPIHAQTRLLPSGPAHEDPPGAGCLAVLAAVMDVLLIPLMIALAFVIHVCVGTSLVTLALSNRGGMVWFLAAYWFEWYFGTCLLADGLLVLFTRGLLVRFARLRWIFRLLWVSGTTAPLLLIGLATFARIDHYGLTEQRYDLAVVVISGSIFFAIALIQRRFDMRIIPLTVAILAGIAAAEPLGFATTTLHSPVARVHAILAAVPHTVTLAMR